MLPSTRQDENSDCWGFSSSVLFCKFIQSIPDNQLVRQKLNCMTKIVESNLFRQSGESPPKLLLTEIPVFCLLQPTLPFFFLNVNNVLANRLLVLEDLLGNRF